MSWTKQYAISCPAQWRCTASGLETKMLDRLLNLFLEIVFYTTGASVLHLFGYKDPDDVAAWLTGFALWAVAILAIFVLAGL